jgi:predicted metal-dependent peptidase
MTKARARLLVRAPFIGSIALGFEWINAPTIGTMATDGRHAWFNPYWCEEIGIEKTMGVIAHEVLHVVNKHHLRRGERDPQVWNTAGDLLINRLLMEDDCILPAEGVFDQERRYAGLPTETIYARLLEERDAQQRAFSQRDCEANEEHRASPAPDNTSPNKTPARQTDQSEAGGSRDVNAEDQVVPARDWGEVHDLRAPNGQALSPTQQHHATQDLDIRIRQAATAAKRARKLSAALREIVETATDHTDWHDRFRISFDGLLRSEVSWTRPSRRFIQHGLYLPGWRRIGPGRIAFVLDTSGSISERELAVYTAGVLGILEETAPDEIALIQCDADVQHVEYPQPGDTLERIEVHGRGGTRFQPAFDWITDSGLDFSAVVYATDLDSGDRPNDPGIPVIWLTPQRGRTMPFGEIVMVGP